MSYVQNIYVYVRRPFQSINRNMLTYNVFKPTYKETYPFPQSNSYMENVHRAFRSTLIKDAMNIRLTERLDYLLNKDYTRSDFKESAKIPTKVSSSQHLRYTTERTDPNQVITDEANVVGRDLIFDYF